MKRVPLPGSHRVSWPGSREAAPVSSKTDVLLTAWLRPRAGGEIDAPAARAIGAISPLQRSYADRKALETQTAADPDAVEHLTRYCEALGITVGRARWRSLTLSAPVETLVEAFGADVAIFEDEDLRRFRHRTGALHVPSEIVSVVRGVFGLHQWPRSRKLSTLQRHATPLLARDVAARYAFPDADGRGQTIAVVQLNGTFNVADFDRCMAAQQLSPAAPVVKRIDDAAIRHEQATLQDLEATLDVQIVAALAPGARIVVYEAPNDERGFLDAVRAAIFDPDDPPSILSISYGWPERLWTPVALEILDDLFAAAALAGISVFCAAGDNGAEVDAEGRAHVVAPASSEFAIACGATAIAGGVESAWENTGGGFSERFGVPPWQQCVPVVASHYGVAAGRGVPDVAAQQSPGYYVVMEGTELAMGGTSAVAPVWAALAARINQRLGVPIGFAAPFLYAPANAACFANVTQGGNGRYEAGAGWNPCTGLGTPIGTALEKTMSS